ncbi:hypothetical protein [Leptospira noguchii]|uniref:hypothetical protein n=1 Tax=Leptospira noguchii TaxID=28182 RepID=UPI000561ECDE|nr:hypothetical protein [Leptospira noguchii]
MNNKNNNEELYDLLYSPIITLENLVGNLRKDVYTSIHFMKTDEGYAVELNARLNKLNNKNVIYHYYFDKQELLQYLIRKSGVDDAETLFDRRESIRRLMDK